MRIPDCHLILEIDNLGNRVRALVDALLRVDLGARIKPDMARNRVDIEGRFSKEDVLTALDALGCRLAQVQERPLSPRSTTSATWGWG